MKYQKNALVHVAKRKSWEEKFQELQEFVRENGRLPRRKEEVWPTNQRSQYKNGKLSQEQIEKLESIPGWYWSK